MIWMKTANSTGRTHFAVTKENAAIRANFAAIMHQITKSKLTRRTIFDRWVLLKTFCFPDAPIFHVKHV